MQKNIIVLFFTLILSFQLQAMKETPCKIELIKQYEEQLNCDCLGTEPWAFDIGLTKKNEQLFTVTCDCKNQKYTSGHHHLKGNRNFFETSTWQKVKNSSGLFDENGQSINPTVLPELTLYLQTIEFIVHHPATNEHPHQPHDTQPFNQSMIFRDENYLQHNKKQTLSIPLADDSKNSLVCSNQHALSLEKYHNDYIIFALTEKKTDACEKYKKATNQILASIYSHNSALYMYTTQPESASGRYINLSLTSSKKIASYEHIPMQALFVKSYKKSDTTYVVIVGARNGSFFDVHEVSFDGTSKKFEKLYNTYFNYK